MVHSVQHMTPCIFYLLLAGVCAARLLPAAAPSTAAPERETIAAAGAPGTGLQDVDHIRLAQSPTNPIAPAPALQEWYGRLTGQEAALVTDVKSALDKEIRDLEERISRQSDGMSITIHNITQSIYIVAACLLVGYFLIIVIWLPMVGSMVTFYSKGLDLILPPRATV